PVAMMMSFRVLVASGYAISGLGFAIAKTMGFLAMLLSMSGVNTSAAERPMNTSDPLTASSNECTSSVVANSAFEESRLGRSARIQPNRSIMITFSFFAPSAIYILVQDMAAAPAPMTTILILSIFFF